MHRRTDDGKRWSLRLCAASAAGHRRRFLPLQAGCCTHGAAHLPSFLSPPSLCFPAHAVCARSATLVTELRAAKATLDASRPTAVNLMWATGRMQELVDAAAARAGASVASVRAAALAEALALAEEDVAINSAIARHGADVVPQGANILHHW